MLVDDEAKEEHNGSLLTVTEVTNSTQTTEMVVVSNSTPTTKVQKTFDAKSQILNKRVVLGLPFIRICDLAITSPLPMSWMPKIYIPSSQCYF